MYDSGLFLQHTETTCNSFHPSVHGTGQTDKSPQPIHAPSVPTQWDFLFQHPLLYTPLLLRTQLPGCKLKLWDTARCNGWTWHRVVWALPRHYSFKLETIVYLRTVQWLSMNDIIWPICRLCLSVCQSVWLTVIICTVICECISVCHLYFLSAEISLYWPIFSPYLYLLYTNWCCTFTSRLYQHGDFVLKTVSLSNTDNISTQTLYQHM